MSSETRFKIQKTEWGEMAHSNAVLKRMGFSVQNSSVPSAQPLPAPRRASRLPVLHTGLQRPAKDVADGCRLQTASPQVHEFVERLNKFHKDHFPVPQLNPVAPLTRLPTNRKGPHRGTHLRVPTACSGVVKYNHQPLVGTPLPPIRPSSAAPIETTGPHHETHLHVSMADSGRNHDHQLLVGPPLPPICPSSAAVVETTGPRSRTHPHVPMADIGGTYDHQLLVGPPLPPIPRSSAAPTKTTPHPSKAKTNTVQNDLQPLMKPFESLSLCFKDLSSDNWEKKIHGFNSLQALARYHQEILQTKLHEVCLILEEEVANLRSVVACAAIDTIAELHTDLGTAMDPEADRTGRALLLKLAQTTSVFIHERANLALDALVEGCSPARVITALLNTGLSHRCAAVRASTALHLHQLADIMGEDQILTASKTFQERFVIAVSKMSVDSSPEARQHGLKILEGLARHRQFMALWIKLIPEKDQKPLKNILKKRAQGKRK